MEERRFTKQDWKLFKEKLPGWQETYIIDKLNREYIEILNGEGNPSDKFWRLEKRIKGDKQSSGVQLQLTRTDMVWNIIALISNEVIFLEDLDGFSDTLKETVDHILAC